jgi:transketolase
LRQGGEILRNAFAEAVIDLDKDTQKPPVFFLTGDLGFMALEGVRDTLKDRFINCGVSEQNMIGVAAGLAKEGFRVFAYSIAPFCYARPFEQIRNDICFQKLPVCLVGNGGGYAYGYMGPTHHALEDCAAMSALGVKVMTPAFDDDLAPMLSMIDAPTYLRLGYDARPTGSTAPCYGGCCGWRKILSGNRGVLAALGPMGGVVWDALKDFADNERPDVWVVTELPLVSIPEEFLGSVKNSGKVCVVEEHVAQGGLGMQCAYHLVWNKVGIRKFIHRHALGYPSGRYGSQNFHRAECGMDIKGIQNIAVMEMNE